MPRKQKKNQLNMLRKKKRKRSIRRKKWNQNHNLNLPRKKLLRKRLLRNKSNLKLFLPIMISQHRKNLKEKENNSTS